jgi:hypothetical protein
MDRGSQSAHVKYEEMILHSDGAMVWCVEGMILGLPTGPGGCIPQLQAYYQGYLKACSKVVLSYI